jgi:hypothetical protein
MDKYTVTAECITRLYKEYTKHKKLVIALDFDDTIFDFHNTGEKHEDVVNLIKRCNKLGFHIVIWTASAPDRYLDIRRHCEQLGISISEINRNPVGLPLKYGHWGKIYYNILLDDRAGLGQAYQTLLAVVQAAELEQRQDDKGNQTSSI